MSSFLQHGCRVCAAAALFAVPAIRAQDTSKPAQASQPSATPFKKIPGQQIEVETQIVETNSELLTMLRRNAKPIPSPESPFPYLLSGKPTPTPLPLPPEIPTPTRAEIIQRLTKASNGTMDLEAPMESAGQLTPAQREAVMRAFMQSKSYKLLGTATIRLKDGGEAAVVMTRKITFATNSSTKSGARDVGGIVNIKAEIGPANETIDLGVDCQSTILLGSLVKNGDKAVLALPANSTKPAKNGAPVFVTVKRDKKTTISLWDGQTAVMGGAMPELQAGANGSELVVVRKAVLILMTARLLDASGKPVNDDYEKEQDEPLPSPDLPPVSTPAH